MKFSTTWLVMALICALFLMFYTSENPTQIGSNIPISENNKAQSLDASIPANPVLKKDHTISPLKTIVPQSLQAHDRAKFLESLPFFAPMITASKSDAFTSDVDMDGFADPGDEIEYTVTISNGMGAMDATNLTFTDMVDANTTLVGASVQASPVSLNDNYTATGNIQITIPAPGVLANDFLGTPTATAMAIANGPTTQGGTVTLNADGSFTYNPPAGYEGDDTFTYTITNSLGNSTATVKITVSGMIWFINAAAGAGDGRLNTPFNSISAFQALNDGMGNHPAAGDNIFIYSGNYTGPITLLNTQKLIGQGASATLSSITGITPPAGSLALPTTTVGMNPVITTTVAATNAITLGMNNLIRGLTVGNTTGHKILGNNFGTVTIGNTTTPDVDLNGTGPALSLTTGALAGRIDELTSTSGANNVLLNTVSGTLNPVSGSITSDGAGAAFSVTGSNPSITYPGTITKNSGAAKVVNIDGTTGNTITFNGTVTGGNASTGVTINNANGNVTFTTLTLGSGGARFTTTPLTINGGTGTYNLGVLSAFSNNTTTFSSTNADGTINCSSTSTLDATNGPAISIDGPAGLTTLGLTFASINCATSTTRGISIQDTDGSFTCNGGTISNIAQRGASFVNATNISLKDMPFTSANTADSDGDPMMGGTCNYSATGSCNAAIYLSTVNTVTLDNVDITGTTVEQGINGASVTTFVLKSSNITNCGTAVEEGCVKLRNLAGTCEIKDNSISRAADRMVDIFNNNTNLTLTVSGNTFDDTQFSTVGSNAIEIVGEGSSQLILDVLDNTFTKNRTFAAEVTARNTATLDFDFTNNTVNPMGGIGNGVQFALENTATGKFNISNNPMIEVKGGTGVTISAKQTSMAEGRIKNNVIKVGGVGEFGYGVGISLEFSPTVKVEVDANTITNVGFDAGIYAASSGVGTANLNLTASNNNITVVDASSQGAFYNQVGDGIGGDTHSACLNIKNNTVTVPAMGFYWTTVVFGGSTANMTGAGANAETVWDGNGNLPNGTLGTTIQEIILGTRNVVALACTLPTNPLPVTSDPVVMLTPTNDDNHISTPATETAAVEIASETQEQKESALSEPSVPVKPQKGNNQSVEKMAPDVTVGPLTLPAGKNLTIKFRVTVNAPPLANCQISNQGLVTFDGGSVMTDDPAVGGATDPTVTPFNPLVADFSGTPLTGCIPLMVDFTDASTSGGTVTSWAWDIDNNASTDYITQNPMHTYTTPGMYTVKLTAMDNLGCTDTETKTNYVNAAEPVVNIAVAPMSVQENMVTPLVFTVTRTGSTDCELIVPFTITGTALEGTDYPDVIPTSFTIPANMTSAMLSITPTGDNIVESDETIIITISDGANYNVGVNSFATGTITNDDMAVISIAATTQAAEDATDGLFTISTDKQFDAPVTINFMVTGTASSGPDYTSIGTSVMLPANMSSATIPIDVIGDAIVELNETVSIKLTSVSNTSGSVAASPNNEATVTINDNDGTATVSIDDVMMLEGNTPNTTNFVFTVSLDKVVDADVTLDFMTMDNTATTANNDYDVNTGMITFPANGTLPQTQTITVVVNGDNAPEPDEQFFVDLKNLAASGRNVVFESAMATERGTGTIQDDDLSLSIGDMMITEGNSGTQILTFTVMLTAPAEPGGVTFDITTADNSATIADNDYELNSLTGQTIPEGMTSYTFDVTINGDMTVELDETFFVNVTNVTGAGVTDAQAIGTIKNDDTEVNVAVNPSSRDENSGLPLTYTFTRTGVITNDLVVNFDLSGSATLVTDYMISGATLVSGSSYTVTIPMNMASADVTVTPVGDMTVELDETVVMTLTSPAAYNIGANNTASGTITNDDMATVSVVGASMNENAGPLNFSVTLSNPVDVDVTVQFSTSDGVATDADNDYEPITNQLVTFLAGTTTAQILPVTINDDNKVETDETFNGNIATLNAGTRNVNILTASATGTILNNMDMATVSLKISDAMKPETNSGEADFTFTIKLDNPVQDGFTLGYHTDDGTAEDENGDGDYDDNDGTIDFLGNAGEEHTITVKVNGDTKVEADETFSVTIETFTNTTLQAFLKTASTYPATIQNDDAATLSINNVSLAEGISGTTTFTFTITLDNPVQGGFDID
ncbi:MAG: Calx-beta domain-containing protein, partial [Saprospiraceae bacterium]|nr:Calx-beta domain-containing protein [Saprospiraceae bacterium]